MAWIPIAKAPVRKILDGGVIEIDQDDETGRVRALVPVRTQKWATDLRREEVGKYFFQFFDNFAGVIETLRAWGYLEDMEFIHVPPKRGAFCEG
jgi:hypothetical protein